MTDHSYKGAVVEYFAEKAAEYDSVDSQAYWRLSDALLWQCIERYVLPSLPAAPSILDAGGGTGRWSQRLLNHLPDSSSLIFDLSPEMTHEAERKAESSGNSDRLTVIHGDLDDVNGSLGDREFDLVICFHNVLGFVTDAHEVLRQLFSLVAPNGKLAVLVPHVHHGVFFNLSLGKSADAARLLETKRGRFTDTMPDMHFFSASELESVLTEAGAGVAAVAGFPAYIYPGYAETQLHGQTSSLGDLLDDPVRFEAVLGIESSQLGQTDLVARGNNLFLVATRSI